MRTKYSKLGMCSQYFSEMNKVHKASEMNEWNCVKWQFDLMIFS